MKKVIVLLFILISINCIAQDRIVKKNGDVIECEVTELGASEIKYYYSEKPKLIFGIDKALVEKVEFKTGETISVSANTYDNPEYYESQGKHAIKISLFSPLAGGTEIAYEQSIKPGRSWETSLGFIGAGFDPANNNPAGAFATFSYKMIRKPDYYMHKMHYSHILKGGYVAPMISFRYAQYDSYTYYSDISSGLYVPEKKREDDFAVAVMLKLGKQWVIDDGFVVDAYFGMGYGYSNSYNGEIGSGFILGDSDTPIALTAGVKLGWVF